MLRHSLLALLLLSSAISTAQERRVTLLFAGDAMHHTPQLTAAKSDSGYHYDSVFELVKHQIAAADIAAVNFETTLGGEPYTGYPQFSAPNEYAIALSDAGFNLFFTANNHALDTGKKGLEQTIQVIKKTGAKQTGTFVSPKERALHYPLMFIKNGIRIAFFNYTYGTNGLKSTAPTIVNLIDTLLIKKDIEAAQLLHPDIMIAVMHWGEEYHTQPSTHQKKIAQFLFNHHIRIIIGHHPHVVQPIQSHRDNQTITHVVFYSLGNFFSNQRKLHTDGGMLAKIVLRKSADQAPVAIESVSHSLVWTHKFFKNRKPHYRLLPAQKDTTGYNLQPYEQWTMDRFVKGAERVVGIGL